MLLEPGLEESEREPLRLEEPGPNAPGRELPKDPDTVEPGPEPVPLVPTLEGLPRCGDPDSEGGAKEEGAEKPVR